VLLLVAVFMPWSHIAELVFMGTVEIPSSQLAVRLSLKKGLPIPRSKWI